ncbi:MAG: fused MFS/spermidine synthase, partial [Planctomycetes bacterium]|nr:fused MFS/spermidine synthase [Planctomycetota bacterium]
PAVWNTAVMFFQGVLLAGYLYAHLLSQVRGLGKQALIHGAVLAAGLLFLPVHVGLAWSPTASAHPVLWLIVLLTVSIGVPFFAISATAPLLQKWFSHSGHRHASDPYFLYVASNLGGMIALLIYPVLVEPRFGLTLQSRLWTAGYALLALLIVLYAAGLWTVQRRQARSEFADIAASADAITLSDTLTRVTWAMRARWVALASVPSALLLAVTLHISTDVAAAPFLWVAPLLLYSLSFILVFARRPILKHKWVLWLQPWAYAFAALYFTEGGDFWFVLTLHLLVLFVAAMVFHGELVRRRPTVEHLTEFYLWLSVGGLLGGVFCAMIAPVVFNSVFEYPLVLALSGLLLPSSGRGRYRYVLDLALPAAFVGLYFFAREYEYKNEKLWDILNWSPTLFCLGIGAILFAFRKRPLRFTLAFSVLLFHAIYLDEIENRIFRDRSFFGVYTVVTNDEGNVHELHHGTTLHGDQDMDDPQRARTYYDPRGPLAQVFETMRAVRKLDHVGVMGLGTGCTTCYQQAGQAMTFFEVDPTIERIARNPRLFRYLELCGPDVKVILGDGRQSLSRMPDGTFNLLILDAFSSDAIPVHLMTREALAIYFQKLTPSGLVLFHISNRFLDLEPVVANLATDAGGIALIQDYDPDSEDEESVNASASTWVVVARDAADLVLFNADDRWRTPTPDARVGVWTDDYSNIFQTMMWGINDYVETLKTHIWDKVFPPAEPNE